MALRTRHRAAIYAAFNTIMGEEEANALLSEFPAAEHDELVTKGHLRAELAEVRVEIAALRAEVAHSANRTLVATSGMLIAGMGVAAAIGRAIGT